MQKHKEDNFIHYLSEEYTQLATSTDIDFTKTVELDLGCGKGSFTTQLADRFPERTILAVDVLRGRLHKLVRRNKREEVTNIVPIRAEARHLLGFMLPDKSLDRLHILCPDPWPKTRHRGHRLLVSDFMGQLNRVLKDDGSFHFSTDDKPYYAFVTETLRKSGLFIQDDTLLDDISDIKSDFERLWEGKGLSVTHSGWRKK